MAKVTYRGVTYDTETRVQEQKHKLSINSFIEVSL